MYPSKVSEENSSLVLRPSSLDVGKRLDAFLSDSVDGWSRSRLQRLVDDGDVLVNGRETKSSYKVRENDEIDVELTELPTARFEPENIPLDIVYEDEFLAVINKPAGMIVHPGAGVSNGTLANAIAYHFGLKGSPPYEGGVDAASADGVVLSGGDTNASLADRWIISRLNKTAKAVNFALETYQFHEAVQLLYHFFWDDFCDWYIELKKDEITSGDVQASTRILAVLEQALRMLHPFMPYLTEELWQKLPGISNGLHNAAYSNAEATIMLTDFPSGRESLIDEQAETEMSAVIELITKVRNIRSEMNIKPSEKVTVHVAANSDFQKIFAENEPQILKLARADKMHMAEKLDVPKASAKAVLTGGAEIAVPLEGLIDFDKERERLQNQLSKLDTELQRLNGQLSNQNFVERAPLEKVQELKDRQAEIEQQALALKGNLAALD